MNEEVGDENSGVTDSTLHEETTPTGLTAIENTPAVPTEPIEGEAATAPTEAIEGEAAAAQPTTSQFTEDVQEFCQQNNLSGDDVIRALNDLEIWTVDDALDRGVWLVSSAVGDLELAMQLMQSFNPELREEQPIEVPFTKLILDPLNYRFSQWLEEEVSTGTTRQEKFLAGVTSDETQDAVVEYLINEEYKIVELADQIKRNGFKVSFPIRVAAFPNHEDWLESEKFLVLDGNRRTAALHYLHRKVRDGSKHHARWCFEQELATSTDELRKGELELLITTLKDDYGADSIEPNATEKGNVSIGEIESILRTLRKIHVTVNDYSSTGDLDRLRGEVQAQHHLEGQLGWDDYSKINALHKLLVASGYEKDARAAFEMVAIRTGLQPKKMEEDLAIRNHHIALQSCDYAVVNSTDIGLTRECFFGRGSKAIREFAGIDDDGSISDPEKHEWLISRMSIGSDPDLREVFTQNVDTSDGKPGFRRVRKLISEWNGLADEDKPNSRLMQWKEGKGDLIELSNLKAKKVVDYRTPLEELVSSPDGILTQLTHRPDWHADIFEERQEFLKAVITPIILKATASRKAIEAFTPPAANAVDEGEVLLQYAEEVEEDFPDLAPFAVHVSDIYLQQKSDGAKPIKHWVQENMTSILTELIDSGQYAEDQIQEIYALMPQDLGVPESTGD